MKRIFSGIRPTGDIHLGNYLGAIKQWVALQNQYQCIFGIVDWHAITTPYDPLKIQKHINETAVTYLAAGVNPKKSLLIVQSQIKEHAELAWLLGCVTPTGELFRMTQYKEKSKAIKASPSAGLLNYPILMAADILLYQTEVVPVGEDQVQHVEFSREVARRFNSQFGPTFNLPRTHVVSATSRIKSLQDPAKKMSKTDDPRGCIGLFDPPRQIKEKIMAAVTDPGKEIKYSPNKKPGISNLLIIYAAFSNKTVKQLEKEFKGRGYAAFKQSLSQVLIDGLAPFRKAQKEISEKQVETILKNSAKRAQKLAQPTILKARKNMGLK